MIEQNSSKLPVRIGVDIGGTFTDIALEIGTQIHSTKLLTNYSAPEQAILDGILKVVEDAGIKLSDIDMVIHGTTLATNALIERRGAKTAFITTQGFRDVLEMRTENRFEQYDLNITLPKPLIPRPDRYTLNERVGAQGQILKALDIDEAETLASVIKQGGYTSVAIGFMHSYLNGEHEAKVRDILLNHIPELSVSISSEVSPQMREFERFNTVCANAYVRPVMESYLHSLVERLKETGIPCPVFMIHSGGGIISVQNAAAFPVRLMESGPAGGAMFAADIANRFDLNSVISFDMGGTTAKICLIEQGRPKTAKTFEVDRSYRFKKGSGMPISIPVIEMVEIGAGGGSLAAVDSMNQIRVGPESAASEPGPACYQRGGKRPAVTDADLILGRLDADNFAGGAIKLSVEASETAMQSEVGEKLTLSPTLAAFGVSEVVDENMANAARAHAVENGKALETYTMIAFGGAAPVHAARLCEKLGIQRLLIPRSAGVGSAVGFLKAPFGYEVVKSAFMRLDLCDMQQVDATLVELSAAAATVLEEGAGGQTIIWERRAYMRYQGQGWEIPIDLPEGPYNETQREEFAQLFEQAYTQFFGRPIEGLPIEIISWTVKASSQLPPVEKVAPLQDTCKVSSEVHRPLFDAALGEFTEAQICERENLAPGQRISGPAIVVERETSTIVTSSFDVIIQNDGSLLLQHKNVAN
ncbi:hydantoinase/oxoprolinase family protein [Klebsiella variicola]|uniref:hydantoinase/oxoprolinase family protein n=1 Tax=Klebsiella variicola TaxID=244366 RepID=UPI0023A9E05E|nr:hydantoinase/oxoprolinase family protein [Klebsiella variicola]MDD9601316.1 hydantoinase/oxoprolinase family protein [Klebsiella variicola]